MVTIGQHRASTPTIQVKTKSDLKVSFLSTDRVDSSADTPIHIIDIAERAAQTKKSVAGVDIWGVNSSYPQVPRNAFEINAAIALIQRLFLEDATVSLSKTAVHKILFRMKALASSDDAIVEALPYYWYNFGPFSQIVEEAIKSLKKTGILMEVEGWKGKSRLRIRRPPLYSHPIISVAEPYLQAAYQEYREKRLFRFVEGIYREAAPFQPFMPRYTHDYLKPLERVSEILEMGESDVDMRIDNSEKIIKSIERSLFDCEAQTIDDPLFDPFNDRFSTLVTHASRVFRLALEEYSLSLLGLTFKTSEAVWMGFSHGVRIHPTAHDTYYNRDVQGWIPIYHSELKRVDIILDSFADTVRATIPNRRSPRSNRCERERKVFESILHGTIG